MVTWWMVWLLMMPPKYFIVCASVGDKVKSVFFPVRVTLGGVTEEKAPSVVPGCHILLMPSFTAHSVVCLSGPKRKVASLQIAHNSDN